MSLIIDALKKAQQLRLKEFKGTPFFKYPHPTDKEGLTSFRKRWMVIGAGLASLLIFLFVFWRSSSPPLTTKLNQAVVLVERKPSISVAEKIPQEPSKKVLSLTKDKEPAEGLPYVGAALSDRPSSPRGEKESPEPKPSLKEKRGEPPIKQMAEEKKVIKVKPHKKNATERSLSPSPPASLKEEVFSKSIGVEQEGRKDRALTSDVLTHFNLGVHFHNQREITKAIQAYQKVIEVDPTYIEAYNNLGIIYQEMGDFNRAFGAYQKSIKINPQYEKGYNNLGILLYLNGRYEEATEAFQKALDINSNNIESHINLGILFKKQGQLNKAIEAYQKALTINPLHGETHYNIALLYEQLENVELAIGHYQQFIKLSSASHSDLVSRVQRHMEYLMKTKGNRK